jgi:hypothetical protein
LDEVAKALKVPVEAIKNFDETAAVSYINTFQDNGKGDFNYNCTFNPLDKMVELYERLLKEKDSMIEELKKLISK